ncbi:PREDICTED: LOW QUALITY PROTEIN: ubiquitin carboxyl-terminal hydrolase 19-like [Camelina sativa]|uniref:LOW QUALITY PROTEIN: ubiquitin carboxyl-terminal hydrolase 19-like n=1 Tax=Camelina sativa TaxID=90675 RepID=A0ABM0TPS6_CAMSA|nr:PREDICTED: LOW QUALITY PROTEIN: ubiquitin carboxyl-terminal hydrolase 19-like [Camelina sativa]
MHEVVLPVDLKFFTQLVLTLFFLSIGLLYFVKKTAAKYFEVGGGSGGFDSDHRRDFMVPDTAECSVCGKETTKKCSRCKSVRYCSAACQKSDWSSGHKLKCKVFRSTDSSSVGRDDDHDFKASLFGNMSASKKTKLALVPKMSQSKVALKPTDVLFPYESFVNYFNWDRPIMAPCGLTNCGNSCFANVVLQCLSWTRPLVAYLLERGHKRECRRNDWCFFCEFETHLDRANYSRYPFSPTNIISRLPNIGGNLGYGRQEDAHELMRFAIDMMQSVCLDEFGGEKVVPPRAQETTLIQYIFGGLLQSQVKCTACSNVSDQYENMMDLTVEIHGDAVSLEECLDQFTAKEWLQGDNLYKCDRCNDYVKACKRLSISCAPNILTIALKRFQGGRFGKLNKRINFPETFDLGPYMSSGGEGSDVYKLYAVIVHLDMLNASFFGHYICYIKDFRGNWYRIDDSKVENVELEDVLSQRAYMLLYSRVQPRPASLRSEEGQDKKKTESSNTESSQEGSVESSEVEANDTNVSSLCNGIISHSEDPECEKESSLSSMSESVPVSEEEGKEVDVRVDTVDSESNPSMEMEHDSGTDHQEEVANGKEDAVVENLAVDSSCLDVTTPSPSAATEFIPQEKEHSDIESKPLEKEQSDTESKPLEKEHLDTEMIDAQ